VVTTHQGFEAAIAAGAKEIAIFASASEGFSKSNINCTIKESIARYNDVALAAKEKEILVRGCALLLCAHDLLFACFKYSLLDFVDKC